MGEEHFDIRYDEIGGVRFSLDETERAMAEVFIKAHHMEDRDSLGATRQQFAFTFIPSTIGTSVTICDRVSGVEADITNIDKW